MSRVYDDLSAVRYIRVIQKLIVAGALGLLALVATPVGQDLVETAGHQIPSQNLVSDYALGVTWAGILALTLLLWPVPRRDRAALMWIWAAKVEVALGFMLFYEWNYGLDAYSYFWTSDPLRYTGEGLTFGNGTEVMRWLCNLHWQYLVGDSYHALKVSCGYIGLIGVYAFYRATVSATRKSDPRALYLIGLFPSTMQWSGILGKDPLTFLGIGLFVAGTVAYYRTRSIRAVVGATLGVLIGASVRPWLAAILLASLSVFLFVRTKRPLWRAAMVAGAGTAFILSLTFFADQLRVSSVDDVVQKTQTISGNFAYGGSRTDSNLATDNSTRKMFLFAPIGIFSALFRPLPGEILNPFGMFAGIENAVLLYLLYRAVRRTRLRQLVQEPLVLWAVTLVMLWSFVYGYVSVLNLGTGARFRLQILPVLLCVLVHLATRSKGRPEPNEASG